MQKLIIQKTSKTPEIVMDPDTGLLKIVGISFSKQIKEFYEPVLKWLDEYGKKPHSKTFLTLKFYYYDTISAKCILNILRKLEVLYNKGFDVKVEWQYEKDDEDCMDSGIDYKDNISLPIEVVEVNGPN